MDLKALEDAANVLMGSPYSTTSEQRSEAEKLFLALRKTPSPYAICKQILETTSNSYVQFEAGVTLKTAVLREWSFLGHDSTDDLCLYLLMYISHHTKLEQFVKQQLFHVIAIIVKRGICHQDQSKQSRDKLFDILKNLVSSSDSPSKMLACGLMRAILEEFSLSSHSSKLGLRFEDHNNCKVVLEKDHLHDILIWTIQILHTFGNIPVSSLSSEDLSLLASYLTLADQVMHWRFVSTNRYSIVWLKTDAFVNVNFKPPKSWKKTMVQSGLCEFFFKLQVCVSQNDELSHLCLQCLLQLASLSGPVLPDVSSKMEYFHQFFSGFLHIANRSKWTSHSAFCAASIVSQIVTVCPMHVFASNAKLLESFLSIATHLTCTFLHLNISEEDEEDSVQFKEASTILLDSVVVLMSHSSEFEGGIFSATAATLFDCYVKCHLTQPDGFQRSLPEENGSNDINCDVEDIDRVAYVDELNDAGMICWNSVPSSLVLLTDQLQRKTAMLQSFLNGTQLQAQSTDSLFEDLHWLVLISTHSLVNDTNATPSVPLEFKQINNLPAHEATLALNSEYLQSCGQISVNADQVHPVIHVVTVLLRLANIYTVDHRQIHRLSPELASDILWCLRCITAAYLCGVEKQKNDMAPLLASFFNANHPTAKWFCQKLADISIDWFTRWSAEPQVVQDAADLLLKLSHGKSRADSIIHNQKIWELARQISHQGHGVLLIPPKAQRSFVTAIAVLACHAQDEAVGARLWQELIGPVQEKYASLRRMPNFSRMAQNEGIKRDIVKVIETLRGITNAILTDNATKISNVTNLFLGDLTEVLAVYKNCPEMVELILELYLDVTSTQLFYLEEENLLQLHRHCFSLLETYTKCRIGHRTTAVPDAEQDQHTDLLLLIRLLTQLISNEWFGSSDLHRIVVHADQPPIDVADIVLFGLHGVIPLMTADLLKFPNLSTEFFKLITFVCQFAPERIRQLPSELYCSLMTAISMALKDFGSDIAKVAMDALSAMASYYFKKVTSKGQQEQPFADTLKHFLKVMFELLLSDEFDMDLVQVASETFFFLVCCHHDYYLILAHELLSQQTEAVVHKRVKEAFEGLMPPADHMINLQKCVIVAFSERLEKFLFEVKGLLCFR